MDPILPSGRCPICGRPQLERLPIGHRMVIERLDHTQPVGGLLAFQCVEEGHIFFVAAKDVEAYSAA